MTHMQKDPTGAGEIAELRAELAELRKDKARLDWLEKQGFSTVDMGGMGVHSWREDRNSPWKWTARWINSGYATCREAIDAAMKERTSD